METTPEAIDTLDTIEKLESPLNVSPKFTSVPEGRQQERKIRE